MNRRILAFVLAGLLAGVSLPGQTAPLGVVTQSALARVNTTEVSAGTTVYDNDRLETEDKGAVNLRAGNVQLLLVENSALLMNHDGSGLTPTLQRGTVVFRAENGAGIRIIAGDVYVRPHAPALTIGQVTLETCSVLVTSRTQSLDVTGGKETRTLEEGKSFRVALGGPCAAAQNRTPPQSPAHGSFLAVPVVVGAVTIWAVHEALESPDRP